MPMTDRVTFRVFGTPKPQGSKTLGAHGGMRESAGPQLAEWRQDVKTALLHELQRVGFAPKDAVELSVVFALGRPRSHYGTGRNADVLKPNAPTMHTQKPDVDKLLRSTLDAIAATGVIRDDCVVAHVRATKTWCDVGEPAGAYITLVDLDHVNVLPRMSRQQRVVESEGTGAAS